jgi:anthranilate synthase component II
MVLLLDNYDSFTWNLAQYLGELGADVRVVRNDATDLKEVDHMAPSHIVVSPGPCDPDKAGISVALIRAFAGRIPILGVCLGHQAIGRAFGGRVVHAARVVHGKADIVQHDGRGVFLGLPARFSAGRYHSLAVQRTSLPECLEVSAHTDDGEIMGLRHRSLRVEGVQFHPESVLTEHGRELLRNFLS